MDDCVVECADREWQRPPLKCLSLGQWKTNWQNDDDVSVSRVEKLLFSKEHQHQHSWTRNRETLLFVCVYTSQILFVCNFFSKVFSKEFTFSLFFHLFFVKLKANICFNYFAFMEEIKLTVNFFDGKVQSLEIKTFSTFFFDTL
jgi:hypothetical protein